MLGYSFEGVAGGGLDGLVGEIVDEVEGGGSSWAAWPPECRSVNEYLGELDPRACKCQHFQAA